MRLFLFLFTFLSVAASIQTQAYAWCAPNHIPSITITPSSKPLIINNRQSFRALSTVKTDSANPYGAHAQTHTFGVARGEYRIAHEIHYQTLINRGRGESCLWFDKINVNVTLSPKVYIAREYPKGSCHYDEILRHEMEHVNVDRDVTNKYVQLLEAALKRELQRQYVYGPVKRVEAKRLARQMQQRINAIVETNNQQMSAERLRKQKAIDSLGNYEKSDRYIKNICDKKNPQIANARDRILKQIYRYNRR